MTIVDGSHPHCDNSRSRATAPGADQLHTLDKAGFDSLARYMALGTRQMITEHCGAKNGGGSWMPRAEAKLASRKRRRRADRIATAFAVTQENPR